MVAACVVTKKPPQLSDVLKFATLYKTFCVQEQLSCDVCAEISPCGSSERKELRLDDQAFASTRELLYGRETSAISETRVRDTGGNWNTRFQEALDMREDTHDEQAIKWERLTSVAREFTAAAETYGKTIISEYFVHINDKSLRCNAPSLMRCTEGDSPCAERINLRSARACALVQ